MEALTWDVFTGLASAEGGLRASIYVPLGAPGDARPGRVRLQRALVEAAGELQVAGLPSAEADAWAAAGREAVDGDADMARGGAVAMFLAGGRAEPVHVAGGTVPLVRVEARPYVVPLLPALQGDGLFFVLALSRHGLRLLRCTRAGAVPVDAPALAETMEDVLGAGSQGDGGAAGGMECVGDRTLRYFQAMAPVVRDAVGGDRTAPVILAGAGELLPLYRQASGNAAVRPGGLAGCAAQTSDAELHRRALPLAAPVLEAAAQTEAERVQTLMGTGLATDDLALIAAKARDGLVDALFLMKAEPVWGRCAAAAGRCEVHAARQPGDEDLVNLAMIRAHLSGARVFARPVYEMAPRASLAAVLRA